MNTDQPAPPLPIHLRIAVNTDDAALLLGVCSRTVAEWGRDGELPVIRRKGRVLFPVEALRRWADANAESSKLEKKDA